ncbi:MAG: hypothetical protein CME68_00580 [Halobacteriovoraceae bacterium]|nr:hypothetical protein [Halobacteriovoraceae bacterium]
MKLTSFWKALTGIIFSLLITPLHTLGEENIAWENMSQGDILDYFQTMKEEKRKKNDFLLKKAKFNILNGNLKAAEFYLKNISTKNKRIFYPKKRLQSLILFLKKDYANSLKILEDPEFSFFSFYKETCLIKVLNLMALSKKKRLTKETEECQEASSKYSKKDHFWLKNTVKVKNGSPIQIGKESPLQLKKLFEDKEMTTLWLKLAIFLNKEKNIVSKLSDLPKKLYRSKKIRELISFIYYRLDQKEMALDFIEDISTANSENIKGNLRLKSREFELAYGHFQLALKNKINSKNALERSLPLSWILRKWKQGKKHLNSLLSEDIDPRKKRSLETAFLIQMGFFKEAHQHLKRLNYDYTGFIPLEINLMNSYVSIINNNEKDLDRFSHEACLKFDGLNCWVRSQLLTWEQFSKTLKRKDPIYKDDRLTLDSLTELSVLRPLKEELIVEQKDIEELDSAEVNLPKGLHYKGIFD